MPNWCSNYVTFTGSEGAIKTLTQTINNAIKTQAETREGQVLTGVMQDGYFFDLYLSDEGKDSVTIMYETRWAPNIPDVALTCKTFGVEAEHDYSEPAMEIEGTTTYKADGTYEDAAMPQEFLSLINYDDDNDLYIYTPTEESNEFREELIDKYYPIWKLENNK